MPLLQAVGSIDSILCTETLQHTHWMTVLVLTSMISTVNIILYTYHTAVTSQRSWLRTTPWCKKGRKKTAFTGHSFLIVSVRT